MSMLLIGVGVPGGSVFSGLLDPFAGSVKFALSSSRTLLSSYSGPLLKVRRSSDNAEQDISALDHVLDEAALAAFVGGGSGFVRTVYDQSENINFGQATAANQPQCATGINSKPTMQFDGSNDGLVSVAGLPALSTWWGYVVVKKTALGSAPEVWGIVSFPEDPSAYRLWEGESGLQTIYYNNSTGLSSSIPMLTNTDYAQLLKGAAASRYAKSSAGDIISDSTNNTIVGGVISTIGYRNDSSAYITGHIAELVLCEGTISAEQETALWTDLNSFYGTPIP